MQGGGRQPKVLIKEATKKGYAEATVGDSINFAVPGSDTRRGRVGKGVANTLDTQCNQATLMTDYRIRKLTPRECWRLQGFPDWAFDKAKEVNSDSQLYKQAGNSVTVNVIYEIAKRLGVQENG
jgi:DNA (cytosine-5)-methyltransferase 1